MKLYGRSYSRCHRTFPPTAFGRFSTHSSEIRSPYRYVRLANVLPHSSKLFAKSVAELVSVVSITESRSCLLLALAVTTNISEMSVARGREPFKLLYSWTKMMIFANLAARSMMTVSGSCFVDAISFARR